jgi:TonB family protein
MMKVTLILFMLPLLCFSKAASWGNDPTNFPEITYEIQEAIGSYSEKRIKVVADSNMLGLRSIYYKYLKKGMDFEGNVLLKFTIAENGKISNIGILSSTTGNTEFDENIKNKIASWKWETMKSGNALSVSILFKFAIIHSNSKCLILSSSRSINNIFQNITNTRLRLHNIYVAFHKLKPDFRGRIVLKYTIAESGEITKVDIMASTTEYHEFDEAVKNEVATWKWRSEKNKSYNGSTTIISEFNFEN